MEKSLNFVQFGTHRSPTLPWNIAAITILKLLLVHFVVCVYEAYFPAVPKNR
jgi:hypothetical protein